MSVQENNPEIYIETDFTIHDLNWRSEARCAEENRYDLFLTPEIESNSKRKKRESLAKEICNRCVVIHDCLVDALINDEYEVRGGLNAAERKAIYPELVTLSDITSPSVKRAADKLGITYVKIDKRIKQT
jgi:WhiB family redox-sensing transcriptional regulator